MNNFDFLVDISKLDYKNREKIIKKMILFEYYVANGNMPYYNLKSTQQLVTNVSCLLRLREKFYLQSRRIKRQLILDIINQFTRDTRIKYFVNETYRIDYRSKFRLYTQNHTWKPLRAIGPLENYVLPF